MRLGYLGTITIFQIVLNTPKNTTPKNACQIFLPILRSSPSLEICPSPGLIQFRLDISGEHSIIFETWSKLRTWPCSVSLHGLLASFKGCFSSGSKGVTVVRALTSHQCCPSSNYDIEVICGLILLLVLSFAARGFFSRYSGFPIS